MVVKLLFRNLSCLFNRIRLKQEKNLFFLKRNDKLADRNHFLTKEGKKFFCEPQKGRCFLRKKLNNRKNKL